MSQDKPVALLPCPFCGGEPEIVTRNVEPQGDPWYGRKDEAFVLCGCGACLFDGDFHEGFYDASTRAPTAWNRRAAPSIPAGVVEAIEALELARPYIESASREMYDGTNGHGIRKEAVRRIGLVDAALSILRSQPKGDA